MAYIGQEPGQGQAERYIFTATAVTDTVTADDNGVLINYTVGQVSVYLNGVKQVVGTDVGVGGMNGSTVVFASDYAIGDVIEVIALSAFSPSDTVSAASGGTFSGAVTFSSTVTMQSANNQGFASGTKMLFNQTAAPTGWTKVTGSGNDTALRVTTGTVGTGGSVAFETAFASQTPTITMSNAAHTLTTAQMPSHNHQMNFFPQGSNYNISYAGLPGHSGGSDQPTGSTTSKGSGSPHTHDNTAASSAINLDVSYVDVIIATKD